MIAAPIDLVFTWVDGHDPAWRSSKRTWMAREGLRGTAEEESSGEAARYENMAEIVYAVRAARAFAPWLRHIYIAVADGQIPPRAALNVAGVQVVPHSAFMPPRVLPTFCSYSIEPFVHRIPGLSDIFLYSNDDFLFWKPTPTSHFLSKDELVLRGHRLNRIATALERRGNLHSRVIARTADLLRRDGLRTVFLPEHTIHVMRRSTCEHAWSRLAPELEHAVGQRFRNDRVCVFWQQIIYSYEMGLAAPRRALSLNMGMVAFDGVESSVFTRAIVSLQLMLLARFPPHTVCLNMIPPEWYGTMHQYLDAHLAKARDSERPGSSAPPPAPSNADAGRRR
jgi:Stealth protein CR2, conserved region 2/Stealth protein CR1, conserved region 1